MVRRSTVAVSTLVPALKVLSTFLPDSTCLSLVRTKAGPLPGFTCWNSTTCQSWFSSLRTMPFFRSFVVAMRQPSSMQMSISTRVDVAISGQRGSLVAALRCDEFESLSVAVDPLAGDHLHGGRGQLRTGVEDRVGVVRPGRRVEDHRGRGVGGVVEPVDQLALVVGLPDDRFDAVLLAPVAAELGELAVGGP